MDLDTRKRLIVVLPEVVACRTELAYTVHWMAAEEDRDVLYVAVTGSGSDLLAVERDMTTMKAVTSANCLSVDWQVSTQDELLSTLRAAYRPGDAIVCQSDQEVEISRFRKVTVVDYLKHKFNGSVRVLSGYCAAKKPDGKMRLHRAYVWVGFLAILALFSWLEIIIDQSLIGAVAKLMLILIFCIEFFAIWLWNANTSS